MPSMRTAYRYVNGILDILNDPSYRCGMSDTKDPRIITPMPRELLKAVDDFRFEGRLASRAEAIRQLIALGLEVAMQKKKKT